MFWNLLSNDDIFISYSRRDANTYASGLADALAAKGFSCYFDRLGADASRELPPSLVRKLKGCSMMVLVSTAGAAGSEAVTREVSEFAQVRGTARIVPIDFGGALAEARWYSRVEGIAAEGESAAALSDGTPSDAVVSRIEKSFKYTRSKQRQRRYNVASLTLLALSTLFAAGASVFASRQITKADDAVRRAAEASAEAEKQRGLAARAETQRAEAETKRAAADAKADVAETKAGEAEEKERGATLRQHTAEAREREATTNARLQEEIGESLRLATQGARSLDQQFDLGLLLSANAPAVQDTYEARNGLLEALRRNPRLLAYVNVGAPPADGRRQSAVSPNGKFLALVVGGGIDVWDLSARRKLYSIGADVLGAKLGDFAFDTGGGALAVASERGVLLWDVARREPMRLIPGSCAACPGAVYNNVTFDPAGKRLAFGGDKAVYLLDLRRPDSAPEIMPVKDEGIVFGPTDLDFSPDGRLLAAAAVTFFVWDVESKKELYGWRGKPSEGFLKRVAFSPDGDNLIAMHPELGHVSVWSLATHMQLKSVSAGGPLTCFDLGRRSKRIAVGGLAVTGDYTIRLLNAKSLATEEVIPLSREDHTTKISFVAGDARIVSVGREVLVWDAVVRNPTIFSRLTRELAAPISSDYNVVALSPSGNYAAAYTVTNAGPKKYDHSLTLWDVRSGETVERPFERIPLGVREMAFTRDGKLLAVLAGEGKPAGRGTTLTVYDVETGRIARGPYSLGDADYMFMAFSPDGEQFATAVKGDPGLTVSLRNLEEFVTTSKGDPGITTFWRTSDGAQLGSLAEAPAYPNGMSYSPDGRLFAYGMSLGRVVVLDAKTHKQVSRMSAGEGHTVSAVAFSPGGKLLATSGPEYGVIVWDAATGRQSSPLMTFVGAWASVESLAFSANGRMLAVGGALRVTDLRDGPDTWRGAGIYPVTLWDLETHQRIAPALFGNFAMITRLAFVPKCDGCAGELIISGTKDRALTAWDASVAEWQRRACWIAGRRLTPTERSLYLKGGAPPEVCTFPEEFYALPPPPPTAAPAPSWLEFWK